MTSIASPTAPCLETVLDALAQPRLLDLYRLFGCEVRDAASSKDKLVRKLASQLQGGLPRLLRELGRDELRAACRKHGLAEDARARVELQILVLRAAGIDPKVATERPPAPRAEDLPTRGQIVHALAQGFGAHDLARVTAVIAPDEHVVRVVGVARLTLFGTGAARLHDEIVGLAAAWSGEASEVEPYKDRVTATRAVALAEKLLATGAVAPNRTISSRVRSHGDALFKALWPHLEAEADALAVEAKKGLVQRARKEADDMRTLLQRQQVAIDKAEANLRQRTLFDVQDKDQKRQVELDLQHLERRRGDAAKELVSEPEAIEALYEVKMTRLTPVGLVVVWPEAMA